MNDTLDTVSGAERLATGLACFSIGLGLAELVAPAGLARLAGLRPTAGTLSTLRAVGLREIGSGLAILNQPGAAGPVWSRVVGDGVDLALLRAASSQGGRTSLSRAAVLGVTVADVLCALHLQRASGSISKIRSGAIDVASAITIARPVQDVYRFWRNFENFPWFMRNLESVRITGERTSHWTVSGPAGVVVEWDAEIVSDQPDHMISWRSVPGSTVENRGAVRFEPAPGDRGTEVHVELTYRPPAGRVGHATAWIFGTSPRQQVREGLRRVKQLLEVGEIPLSDGPGLSRPAQPPATAQAANEFVGVQA
jgi:uncharacterized membrane protein